jgi:hypothetical protein
MMEKNKWPVTKAWDEFMRGTDYKNRIAHYRTVDENVRFFEGDQWTGVSAPNLPTPVFNIIKPAGRFMAVQIKDRKLALKYSASGADEEVGVLMNQMTDYARRTWGRLKMEYKNLEGLIDAFTTGDYILYHWWNSEIETGQPFKGDIDSMRIDNVNYYPGNPNSADVQTQPYILLVFRELTENVKQAAAKNKLGKADMERIVSDEDTEFTAGDMGKIELDKGEKCNVILRMWKEDGEVWFAKYTQHVCVQPPTKAGLTLYPVCMMNWMPRKNCCHGVAEVTYLKSNQVYINKQMAFTQLYLLQTAYPKVLFNKTVIPEWTNKVAAAIGVNGGVEDVARYMQPPQIPFDVWKGFDTTLKTTMELCGVNDAALGNIVNPDNKSAFVAIREAAIAPLQAQQERFFQMMRDMALVWLDFWIHHYGEGRMIPIDANGETVQVPFQARRYEDCVFDADVEVGESAMWSELNTVQTLDKLLEGGVITKSQYYKRMPEGYLPDKQELYELAAQEEEAAKQAGMPGGAQGGAGMPPMGPGGAPQGAGMTAGGSGNALQISGSAPVGMGMPPMDMGSAAVNLDSASGNAGMPLMDMGGAAGNAGSAPQELPPGLPPDLLAQIAGGK